MGPETHQLPKIDFSGLDHNSPGGDGWNIARAQLMQALQSCRFFEALYDEVSPQLQEALLGRAMVEAFSLPLETKMRPISDVPYQGYLGQIPGMTYESLYVGEAWKLEAAERYTRLMWPEGNSSFRDTVCTYTKHLKELEQMIVRMVLEDMGIEKYYDSYIESTKHALRLTEYGIPLDQEEKRHLPPHFDMSLVTIINQHQVEGLEVETRDGEWIHVVPSPNSFTVVIGEAFEAWTNGRVKPTNHRVTVTNNGRRYSSLVGSSPRDGYMVQPPEELVDEEHPLLYKPYNYNDYLRFCSSKEGTRANYKNRMKAFCGAGGGEM